MDPVTGPFVRELGNSVTNVVQSSYDKAIGWRQEPPFTLALPYSRLISKITSYSGVAVAPSCFNNAYTAATYNNVICNFRTLTALTQTNYQATIVRAQSAVRERISNELSEKVELLVTIAERREAYQMVLKRLTDLYRFIRALRHPNARQMRQFFTGSALPRKFRDTLEFRLRNWRSVAKDLGSAWLEFHFGWEPIVRDIDSLMQLLSGPSPEVTVQVRSPKYPIGASQETVRTNPWSRTSGAHSGHVQAFADCRLKLDDAPRAYRSVLGLNNPILVAYSLIPFTWMLDWVNTLGSYISQFSDMSGYKVLQASYSWKSTVVGYSKHEYPKGTIQRKNSWSGVYFERQVGIPSITLGWRPLPNRLSVIRGTTLASLLAIKFDPKKTPERSPFYGVKWEDLPYTE